MPFFIWLFGCGLVEIAEIVVERLVDFDVYVDRDVDRLDFAFRLDFMLRAASDKDCGGERRECGPDMDFFHENLLLIAVY